MLYREIGIGLVIAGFVAQLGNDVFGSIFVEHAPRPLPALESVVVGPLVAALSFVCSVGNVPVAAVLWSGGISFAGVLAFLFADLIVLPIVLIYRKYYGPRFALRITALMFVAMAAAALAVDAVFGAAGAIPSGARPTRAEIFGSIRIDYTLALNIAASAVFTAMMWLTVRRGAADPVCGMTVDRTSALTRELDGRTYSFCSEHCRHDFDADPQRYRGAHRRRLRGGRVAAQ